MPTKPRFKWLAKAGYTARGVVFLLIAGLALFSGVAAGKPEAKSALSTLLNQPFGRVWVGLIGVGLLSFVAWRLAQALADSDDHGTGAKGVAVRAALLGSAVTYIGVASYALGHAVNMAGGSEGSGERSLAEWIMGQPFGSYLAIFIGVGFIVGGVVTASKGVMRRFEKYVRIPHQNGVLTTICIYGLVSRGVVFAATGLLFAYAGFRVDPSEAGSMSDALDWLSQLPLGSVIYAVTAIGLAAFGIYNLIEARYRIVRGPTKRDIELAIPFRS